MQYFPNSSINAGKIRSTVTNTVAKSKVLTDKSSHMLMSFLSTILTGVLVLALSVFLYATFYYAYMPVEMHHIPIHLQFQPCRDTSTRCSFPAANLSLSRNQKLHQGQTYSISLRLEIPDSPVNENHGMFMTCLKISTAIGEQIGESCKSSISQYRSPLLRTMETVTYSPTLLTGWSSQKQDIHINYFSNFQTDPRTPAERINVEIQSKHLEVSEASLEIHAELKGLKYLMYRHPWISSFFGVSTFISILATIILVSWARFLQNEEASFVPERETADITPSKPPTASSIGSESPPPTTSSGPGPEPDAQSKSAVVDSSESEINLAKPSFIRRVLWFLAKHLVWKSTKLFVVVTLCVVLYEVTMQGVDTNNLDLLIEATKRDLVVVAHFVNQKFLVLVELVRRNIV